jgi:Ribbon-helix-helix domain
MTRLQIILTEEQDRRLKELARKRKTSKSRLVREGIELVLQQKQDRMRDPLLDLIGQAGRIGRKDISRRHDAYLVMVERAQNR